MSAAAEPADGMTAGVSAAPSAARAFVAASRTMLLDGLRIVVTRPAAQAAALAGLIRADGGVPVLFPTIDIVALDDCAALDAALDRLSGFDLAVFVSANAVQHALARLGARGLLWPGQLRAAAAGPATAAQLSARGIENVMHPPQRFDSEGLLAELDRQGATPQRVLIVRGSGGREWLLDALAARGVAVQAVASYARARGSADSAPLCRLAADHALDAITVTSSEGGENLMAMLGADAAAIVNQVPLFVPHPRIAARMRALDCTHVIETAGGDVGLMAGLHAHFAPKGAPTALTHMGELMPEHCARGAA